MTWISLLVRLSSLVVILPLVLNRFAPAEVAVWMLFSSIFTMALVLDLGLTPTFSRFFSYALSGVGVERLAPFQHGPQHSGRALRAEDPAPAVSRVFAALRWIYPRLAVGSVTFFSLVGTALLQDTISQCPDPAGMWIAWAGVLVGAYAGIVGNAFSAAMQGMNEVAMQKRLEAILGGAQAISCFAVLAFGGSILELILAYQSWTVIGAFANRDLIVRRFKYLKNVRPERDGELLGVLWPAAWRSGLGVLMSHGLIQASGLIYSQLVSPHELASYLLALRVVTVVSQLSQAPFYSKLPELARLYAAGELAKCVALASRCMKHAQVILVAGVVTVALLSGTLLNLIGSETSFVPLSQWALIAIAFFAERLGAMHLQLFSVTNHIIWHVANGVTGTLMIALGVSLYPNLGVTALPTAMLIAYSIFYAPYASRASSRALGFSIWRFETGVSLLPFMCLVFALGAIALLRGFAAL